MMENYTTDSAGFSNYKIPPHVIKIKLDTSTRELYPSRKTYVIKGKKKKKSYGVFFYLTIRVRGVIILIMHISFTMLSHKETTYYTCENFVIQWILYFTAAKIFSKSVTSK